MTRIRVLMRVIKLLEAGFIPYDHISQARDKDHKPVTYMHPDAVKFNITGAVVRSIYDLTGDPANKRNELWDATLSVFKNRYGGWIQMYDAFEKMDKETALTMLKQQLDDWNRI